MSESAASPLRIVLPGPPASGKGTRERRLAASHGLGFPGAATLPREEMETGTPFGKLAPPILDRCQYLPDELMCRIQNLKPLIACDATAPQDLVAENLLDHFIRHPNTRPV